MYGISDDHIADADRRPADWLPYLCGYQDAMAGQERVPRRPKPAPEYDQGYDRALKVETGEARPPKWLVVKS